IQPLALCVEWVLASQRHCSTQRGVPMHANEDRADPARTMKRRMFLGAASAGAIAALTASSASATPGGHGHGHGPGCGSGPVPEAVPSAEKVRFPEAAFATEPDAPGVLNVKAL